MSFQRTKINQNRKLNVRRLGQCCQGQSEESKGFLPPSANQMFERKRGLEALDKGRITCYSEGCSPPNLKNIRKSNWGSCSRNLGLLFWTFVVPMVGFFACSFEISGRDVFVQKIISFLKWMFPKIGVGPPILIGCSIIFTIHFGGFPPIFGNTSIYKPGNVFHVCLTWVLDFLKSIFPQKLLVTNS